MKIVIIGGHHISALVVAKKLKQQGHQVFWFSCRFPRSSEKIEGLEYLQVKAAGLPFIDLNTGKFHKNFFSWWRIPLGFFQALYYLIKIKPDTVLAFGGYIAAPVVLAAWFLRIPAFTHEQTRTAGLANRFLAHFVKKIFLSWDGSKKFFPPKKVIVVGLPLRYQIINAQKKKIFKNDLPIIMVVGGRQGSHIINCAVGEILEKILTTYNLIHQCGDILTMKDFYDLNKKRERLEQNLKERYLLKSFFNDDQIAICLKAADLVVSRAGAHIVYELAMLGKPTIFIPIPFAFADEQTQNAKFFTQHGAGEIISQEKFNSQLLLRTITKMNNNLKIYKNHANQLPKFVRKDATEKIVKYLENFWDES
jgi:UDP-N-acetylglucosamine--N-acetylmuramyl-(pentapeptide) pyrophosphoryl-undecaprenol N-acetylglucosamine transferase